MFKYSPLYKEFLSVFKVVFEYMEVGGEDESFYDFTCIAHNNQECGPCSLCVFPMIVVVDYPSKIHPQDRICTGCFAYDVVTCHCDDMSHWGNKSRWLKTIDLA